VSQVPQRREKAALSTPTKTTFPPEGLAATLGTVNDRRGEQRTGNSLRDLRDEQGIDVTLQNLLRALTLNLELRARYRVFEFEASQDGHPETARLFRELRLAESEQITELMAGLQARLGQIDTARTEGIA
jgi:hypothetical protein